MRQQHIHRPSHTIFDYRGDDNITTNTDDGASAASAIASCHRVPSSNSSNVYYGNRGRIFNLEYLIMVSRCPDPLNEKNMTLIPLPLRPHHLMLFAFRLPTTASGHCHTLSCYITEILPGTLIQ